MLVILQADWQVLEQRVIPMYYSDGRSQPIPITLGITGFESNSLDDTPMTLTLEMAHLLQR